MIHLSKVILQCWFLQFWLTWQELYYIKQIEQRQKGKKIFPKVFKLATVLDRITVENESMDRRSRYEKFFSKNPKFIKHLRIFGEAGAVTVKKKKMQPKGGTCMFVGHVTEHDGDCYEMWHIKRNINYITRDVIWLRQMYLTKIIDELDNEDHMPVALQVNETRESVDNTNTKNVIKVENNNDNEEDVNIEQDDEYRNVEVTNANLQIMR